MLKIHESKVVHPLPLYTLIYKTYTIVKFYTMEAKKESI